MGGIIAASFLLAIKKTIIFRDDKIQASYRWVPIYVSVMAWAFSTYLVTKGLKQVWGQFINTLNGLPLVDLAPQSKPSFFAAVLIGFLIGVLVFWIVKKSLASNLQHMKNDRASVNAQFTIPLIFAAALLSFAHGANDVANAIGPLAAINDAIMSGGITDKAGIPLWVMAVGALGIAIGLGLYGPRLIRTVGGEITELDQMRAYSIAMAAALTVIIASQLGLPVSTTHIAIGGVFGVGFLREWLDESNKIERQIDREKAEIKDDKKMLNSLRGELKKLEKKPSKTVDEYQRITELYRLIDEEESALKKAKKVLKKEKKNLFVKRDMVKKIVTAWVVTVPAAATLSACIFFMIKGIML